MEEANQLMVNSLICDFTDDKIKKAVETIDGDSPLYYALGLIDAMGNFIIFNQVDQEIVFCNGKYALFLSEPVKDSSRRITCRYIIVMPGSVKCKDCRAFCIIL